MSPAECFVTPYLICAGGGLFSLNKSALSNFVDETWELTVIAPEAPQIKLNGDAQIEIEATALFQDPGGYITDSLQGRSLDNLLVNNASGVDIDRLGVYIVQYSMVGKDKQGLTATSVFRRVTVVDTIPPVGFDEHSSLP